MSDTTLTVHGVLMDIFNQGVLLCGESGIGKSELALGLINRGHRLVADDSVELVKQRQELVGRCPELLQDFLEVRGIGILNIRAMFGAHAIQSMKNLNLIVNILQVSQAELHQIDRLEGVHGIRSLLEVGIPTVGVPVSPGRNLAILVEAAVKNHQLVLAGYNANDDFTNKHHTLMYRDANEQ